MGIRFILERVASNLVLRYSIPYVVSSLYLRSTEYGVHLTYIIVFSPISNFWGLDPSLNRIYIILWESPTLFDLPSLFQKCHTKKAKKRSDSWRHSNFGAYSWHRSELRKNAGDAWAYEINTYSVLRPVLDDDHRRENANGRWRWGTCLLVGPAKRGQQYQVSK